MGAESPALGSRAMLTSSSVRLPCWVPSVRHIECNVILLTHWGASFVERGDGGAGCIPHHEWLGLEPALSCTLLVPSPRFFTTPPPPAPSPPHPTHTGETHKDNSKR